ncbi:MAG: hypothetical protein IJX40_01050 [Alistipes sp.]|nr:hypothetical protein [Alistipes sp.]
MRKVVNILVCVVALIASGCTFSDGDGRRDNVDNVVARVDRKCLMRDDVVRDMPAGLTGVDSATFVRMYVDNWVLNQLKMRRAEQVLSSYEDDIERLVEDYRQSLIMRQLDQYYIDNAIDVEITDKQLSAYYRANAASFKLDHNIVRGVIVKAPRTFRNTTTLSTALKGVVKSDNTEEVAAIVEKHNLLMTDLTPQWVSYSDFLSNLPTERSRSYADLLDKDGVQQMTSDDATFYFIIVDVVRKGSIAPLESVENDIRRRLYAERRAEIVGDYEAELKREAVEAGRVSLKDTVLLKAMRYRKEEITADTEVREATENIDEMDLE